MKTLFFTGTMALALTLGANAQQTIFDTFKKKKKEEPKTEVSEKKGPEKPLAIPPKTAYTDPYDISGVYYLSRELLSEANAVDDRGYASISDNRYFSQVSFEYDTAKFQLNIYYHEGKAPMKAYVEQLVWKGLKSGAITYDYLPFALDNVTHVKEGWDSKIIFPLEKDVYLIAFEYGGYDTDVRLDCSSAKFTTDPKKEQRNYVILGKSKARVEALNANPALVDSLYLKSNIESCELYNRARAATNVMPVEGLKDPKLKAEALAFAKKEQAASTRNEKVEYSYISGKDWNYVRHPQSGVILRRVIRTVTIVKIGDKCAYEFGVITQHYDGAKYGPSIWGGNGAPMMIDCKDAYKYQ